MRGSMGARRAVSRQASRWLTVVAGLLCCGLVFFQRSAIAAPEIEPEAAEPDTPRRALERFLLAYHKGRYAEAARELPLLPEQQPRGEELARRLGEVLDSRFGTDSDWLAKV